jgi:hypothetical protein
MKQHKLFRQGMAATLFYSLIVGCSTFWPQYASTLTPIVSTETLKPIFTPTVSSAPIPSVTPSARPPRTATPLPGWVTDFAEPILAVIADRPPVCQDDFSQASPDWKSEMLNCPNNGCSISDGFLRMTAFQGKNNDWAIMTVPCDAKFTMFVLRVDIDTSRLVGENSADIGYNNGEHDIDIEIKNKGRWWSHIDAGRGGVDSGQLLRPVPQIITTTIIMGETGFAVYLNDTPITMQKYTPVKNNLGLTLRAWAGEPTSAIVMYDNLKIWDLDNIPNLP